MRRVNYFKVVVSILLISLGMNVYLSVNKHIYKEKALKDTYSDLRKVKDKAKNSEEVLEVILKKEKYEGVEILYVYNDFEVMSNSITNLWCDYSFFEEKPVITGRKINMNSQLQGEVFYRIEEYLNNMLAKIMLDNKKDYSLKEKERKDIEKIKSFLNEIHTVFKEYNENELSGLEGEIREKEVMKKEYWIDMLDKINDINMKYSDYDFSNEAQEQNNI
ncbi:MAG: hypothetical protein ACRDAU_02025 [Clostridium sp.]